MFLLDVKFLIFEEYETEKEEKTGVCNQKAEYTIINFSIHVVQVITISGY